MKQEFPRNEDSLAAGNVVVGEFDPPPAHEIVLHDETLRDGEQTCGVAFRPEEKIEIAGALMAAGVKHLSLGFPAVSEEEREIIRAIVRSADDASGFSCLARLKKSDLDAVVAAEIPTVALFIPISDIHLEHKLRMTEEQAFADMKSGIEAAVAEGLKVRFAFEDATRTPLDRLRRFSAAALECGATMITVCDTNGVLTPLGAYRLVEHLGREVGGYLCAHFHNDLGMATANSLAAAAAGAQMVQATLSGIGERAGNTRIEEIAVALRVKYGGAAGIDLPALLALAGRIRERVGFGHPPNTPITGDFAFAHESGIHVSGILREATTYEPFPASVVGAEHKVYYGKHSGAASVRYAATRRGLEVDEAREQAVLATLKARAVAGERLSEDDVADLLAEKRA